jgi:hypothetical protein
MIYLLSFLLFFSSVSASDLSSCLKYIAMRHIHASDDDHLQYEEAKKAIKHRKLRMTCGSISHFTERFLKEQGFQCRFILTLTLDEWNDYNNGHSMVEVYQHNRWELWDINQKKYFEFEGEHINARTFCKIQYMPYKIIKMNNDPIFPEEDKNSWLAILTSNDAKRRNWYARVCQIPMIRENEIFYFTSDEQDRKRIESYPFCGPFCFLKKDEFDNRFYFDK